MQTIPLILIAALPAFAQVTRLPNGQTISQAPAQPPASFDCSADGMVVNSVTGEPIVRAHINITSAGTAYSTATDTAGKWTLSNVACTRGQLQVTRAGFLQTTVNPNLLTLVSGSPVHDIRTELTPHSVVFGKVVDDQGDPVMGAQVTVLSSRIIDGLARFQQAGIGTTNDLGEYRIPNLRRGKYIACVHLNQPNGPPQAGAQTITADSCYPGMPEGGLASAMDLPAGRESKVDFTLNQAPAVHVRGTVTGLPEGRGSGIRIVRRGVDWGSNISGNVRDVRDGTFDFRVPAGAYMLAADYFEAGKRLSARVPIDAGSSDIDGIVVHLEPGFNVTGIVRTASQSGRAVTQQFGVNLRSPDPGSGGQMKWDADHTSFTISEMAPGSYRLEVFPPPPFYVKSATLAGQDILHNEVTIEQAAGPIEIQLSDDGGSIEGDVVDANGQPVAAGVLVLRGSFRAANLRSQSSGHFKLPGVAPGDYTIYAWDDPNEVAYADPDWMRRNGGGGVAVTVASGQSQQIKLTEQLVPAQ